MFGFFKKKPQEPQPPAIFDINGMPLSENDMVMSQRYDLGRSKIILDGLHYYYESEASGQRISYTKMVDAITGHQKVLLLEG